MEFILFIFFLIVALGLVVTLSIYINLGKSKKRKFMVWGVTAMLLIGPLVSYIIGVIYATFVDNGFSGMALSGIVFSIIFIIGLTVSLIGILGLKKITN
ncbi:hypothetical protein [Ureibacillus aquaedulcis]|uniref:YesK-like protein n=1 Tax=Ureibacillus aquaedulcis TaxID=3058421 RepID=A0ABT8GM98_9BACL|nr:hypothetical protein [Ureibacillus sp. BA0131]MDN4492538.1 hypothetical protein [Ureibacillus sp. BA0131]